jgi:hypothetical protein
MNCTKYGVCGKDALADSQLPQMRLFRRFLKKPWKSVGAITDAPLENSASVRTRTQAGAIRQVSYLSRFMTLHPGDIISTGTPPGVALGMATPRYLREGDEVRLGIDGLGEQRQLVVPGE